MIKKYLSLPILHYLRFFARIQLAKINPTIIGITGSAGKTSLRKAVSIILQDNGTVKQSHKANSESGIPLDILGIAPNNYSVMDWTRLIFLAPIMAIINWENYKYYVVEMGIDSPHSPKNMRYLLTIVRPHIGVILNASLAHTANFDTLVSDKNPTRRASKIIELIAKEKGKMVTTMDSKQQIAVLNQDQKPVYNLRKSTKARVFTFGKAKNSTIQITKVTQKPNSFSVKYKYQNILHTLSLTDISLEESYAHTFAAALAVGISVGIPITTSITLLEKSYTPPPGRWSIFDGKNNTNIIDSSYNASPTTMEKALKDLSKLAKRSKKIAVIGDMRELGKETKQTHRELADWIANNTDRAFLFGDATKEHTLPILKTKKHKTKHYKSIDVLTKDLKQEMTAGTWVLVKGSQNNLLLERVVEKIIKDKKDVSKLCRRGKYWDNIRSKTS